MRSCPYTFETAYGDMGLNGLVSANKTILNYTGSGNIVPYSFLACSAVNILQIKLQVHFFTEPANMIFVFVFLFGLHLSRLAVPIQFIIWVSGEFSNDLGTKDCAAKWNT